MKTKLSFVFAVGLLGAAGSLLAATPDPSVEPRVVVTFDHPEKFTDVKDTMMGSDSGRDAYLTILQEHLQRQVLKYIPEGQKLEVTITDVDLAGDFEPARGAGMQDVRIIRDVYPPRIDLTFKLTDASGAVVMEGTRQLRDLSFRSNLQINNSDTLKYEKRLLTDWVSSEFPKNKK